MLVFEAAERSPDKVLKLKFEALRDFDPDERRIVEGVLDSLLVQHQAKRLFGQTTPPANAATSVPQSRNGKRRASR